MTKTRVAINGFGRIGRLSLRANLENDAVEIVAINDPGDINQQAHLFKYDSVYGKFNGTVEAKGDHMLINGKKIPYFSDREPENLPWGEHNVDIVLECTGVFRDKEGASKHLKAGAKKVLISAPGKGVDLTMCYGVNENDFDPSKHDIVSNASCTTGGLAPATKVIDDNFTIIHGLMTTIHSYTADQCIVDGTHKKDWRRARAAALSIIPTETGAAKAIGEVMPHLNGKLDGLALRIPTPTVSMVDVVFEVEKETTAEEVNAAFEKAAQGELKGIIEVTHEPLVSMDLKGNPHSAILDAELTKVSQGRMVKIMTWYDNEWGYACRLVDMARKMGEKL